MALDLKDCTFFGPALPEPFVKFELENLLNKDKLLPSNVGVEGKQLQNEWEAYRRKLRDLGEQGGPIRVLNHVFQPLVKLLGYDEIEKSEDVITREDTKNGEDGGYLITTSDKTNKLRVWTIEVGIDLDAPNKRGRAYRFSPSRIAQRVLLAKSERVGLLTDGQELRLLICDPARPDSHIVIRLDRGEGGWRSARNLPDSFRFLLALVSPKGIAKVPDLTEKARLSQTEVTKTLRLQARQAVEGFVQGILDHPKNTEKLTLSNEYKDKNFLAKQLWSEGLIFVYRLLFVFKLESSADPARAFSFASTSLWRNTYSPNTALAKYAREVIDKGAETGQILEAGLRVLFKLFAEGLSVNELNIKPLGGMLFGSGATKLIDNLAWGEQAVATLLDKLLWTPKGKIERQRVHYGSLDVEDLGRVYEALLELEPGIATEPMCRLRRQKLEVVVPIAQGERYRTSVVTKNEVEANTNEDELEDMDNEEDTDEESSNSGKKTKVEWIEAINADSFYLRVGLGRKASGSYYTPHAFVRFLVQETLGVQVAECSPANNPKPMEILKLKALDPAMGSGHFLVEACRFLGEKLYEACRLCDELASEAEEKAKKAVSESERKEFENLVIELINRVKDLPDPNNELLAYLPSRVVEGEESGLSQWKALALCRRLIAVHCLYGVDKNPLAVELAKLSLWLESYAEGLPLTFLDHRLICGDSLTGTFFEHLLTYPSSGKSIEEFFPEITFSIKKQLTNTLNSALSNIKDLEASIGKDLADIEHKRLAKSRLDKALEPFKLLAAAWSGGVMLGKDCCDNAAYAKLLEAVAEKADVQAIINKDPNLTKMVATGSEGIAYDLVFPEVFYLDAKMNCRTGFDVVLGNPPWEGIDTSNKEFFAVWEFSLMDEENIKSINKTIANLLERTEVKLAREIYDNNLNSIKRATVSYFSYINQASDSASAATPDLYQCFTERTFQLTKLNGYMGLVLPSGIHANEGATGLRKMLLYRSAIKRCFSFENKKKLFEIDSRIKFALIVSCRNERGTDGFTCAFYLHNVDWLFSNNQQDALAYSLQFLVDTTGDNLNFLELRNGRSVPIAQKAYSTKASNFGKLRTEWKILPTEELHTSKQRHRTHSIEQLGLSIDGDLRKSKQLKELIGRGILLVAKGEHFHQYNDLWGERPKVITTLIDMEGKESRLKASQYFRLVFRQQARSTDERTVISNISQPGLLYFHSALPEKCPELRPTAQALILVSLCNTFVFDWLVRQVVAANITFNFLDTTPTPDLKKLSRLLAHLSLQLVCNHSGYAPLWSEQVGSVWREPNKDAFIWPVLATDDERWAVRAVIDAVVADAYGLSCDQYKYVLSTFSHKSYPKAPTLCLAAFDELKAIGLEAFTKKHDPYWDIPLNEELPKPVIELPQLSIEETDTYGNDNTKNKKKSKNSKQMSLF